MCGTRGDVSEKLGMAEEFVCESEIQVACSRAKPSRVLSGAKPNLNRLHPGGQGRMGGLDWAIHLQLFCKNIRFQWMLSSCLSEGWLLRKIYIHVSSHRWPFFSWNNQCTMCQAIELASLKVLKSKGTFFAQFWSKSENSTFEWWKTLQKLKEKYCHYKYVKNVTFIGKKHVPGVREV